MDEGAGFARSLLGSRPWLDSLWRRRDRLATLPAMIIWGMEDRFIRPSFIARWKLIWPHAVVHEIPDAGHWVAEAKRPELVPSIASFLHRQGGSA